MPQKRFGIVAVTIAAVLAFASGAAAAAFFFAHLGDYAANSSLLARATVNVAALEHLKNGNVEGASQVLWTDLDPFLNFVATDDSDLTPKQRENATKLRAKADVLKQSIGSRSP